jgi:hypothetical protein
MGALSILHWVIVLLVFGVPLGLIIRAKKRNAGGVRLGTFRDLTALGKWIRRFFYAVFALYLVGLALRIFLPAQVLIFERDPVFVIGAIDITVFYASLIPFLTWIYRANSNARSLGASGMEFTPGWSVGWFFVPLANLVKPYQVMRELWRTSSNPGDWKGEPVPAKIGAWWGAWWAVFLLSSFESDNPRDAQQAILAFEVFVILLLWVQLRIMNDIQSRQIYHHALAVHAPLDKGADGPRRVEGP